jgi:hypothetical protein
LPILNRFFISIPPTLQRPHKSIPEKVKPFGWLAQCLLFHLKQLITASRLQWALLYLRRSQKNNLDYHELKNLEANDG